MKKILGVFVLGAMLAVPGMASAADPLPEGFIAVSDKEMNWSDAKAFCEQQGGRLPLIGGSESLQIPDVKEGAPIDGFGAFRGPWPVGLPTATMGNAYWAGTENAGNPGLSWFVYAMSGNIRALGIGRHDELRRVVCVPK